MNNERYTEVLDQLDALTNNNTCDFPIFGNSFCYVDSRMTVYADKRYWGILIEVVEVNRNGYGHGQNLNRLIRFGNHLIYPPGTRESDYFEITSDAGNESVFGDPKSYEGDYLNPKAKRLMLRGRGVPIPKDTQIYKQKGIELLDSDKITQKEVLRALTPEYRVYFFLTEQEKQLAFLSPIPFLLQLEKWRHPSVNENFIQEYPSSCEAFQMIAQVIATCDPSLYKPTEEPNTHWKNWLTADKYL